jgi:hypothetical protein
MDGEASIGVGWCPVPTTVWVDMTYKNFVFQGHRFFSVGLALLVLRGNSLCYSNVGAKFRSNNFHI